MTKREICERLLAIWEMEPYKNTAESIKRLLLDLVSPETEEPKAEEKKEPKSKFPIGHPLHMSTEEMKAADTALFIQTGGRMGKDWRNAEKRGEGEK